METVRYSLIAKEDIKVSPRNGTFEVTLADGSVVILSALDVAYLLSDAYPTATIPSDLAVGQVYRLTDGIRGLWAVSQSGNRYSLSGKTLDVAEFGAKGDGATDDTTAIQAALNAVPSMGGIVLFPPGTYIVSTVLTPLANTFLMGSGNRNSTLKAATGQIDMNLVHFNAVSNCRVEHLGFQAGRRAYDADANRALGNGVQITSGTNIAVRACYFTRCHNGVLDQNSTNVAVEDCEFVIDHRAYCCVYFRGTADGRIRGNYMQQALASGAGVLYPIQIADGTNSASENLLASNHVSNNMASSLFVNSGLRSMV